MRRRIVCSCLYGIGSGIMLYYIQLVAYDLIYPSISGNIGLLFSLTNVMGVLLVSTAICFKNRSFWPAVLRWILSISSFIASLLVNGHIGTISLLWQRFDMEVGVMAQNAIGMLWFVTMVLAFGIALIIVMIIGIVSVIKRNWSKHDWKSSEMKEN